MLVDYAEFNSVIGNNLYEIDPNLRQIFDRSLQGPERQTAEVVANQFGELLGKKIAARSEVVDKNGPILKTYDNWGQRISEVQHHPYWNENKADLVRNGFCNLPKAFGAPVAGVVIASVNYLLSQCDTALLCALGMTTAAATIAQLHAPLNIRDQIVARLTSIDPDEAWEAGMFLTERQGGSDVGANTTTAYPDGDDWRIYGEKFFCSNVDAEIFVVLARPEGAQPGSRGLATFLVPRKLPDGSDNAFEIKRLKPKLGTVGVPTGEVILNGSLAWLAHYEKPKAYEESSINLARDQKGIVRMMEMVNASRFGVALMGLGIHRRSFLEGAIYAAKRFQFGKRIDSYPMIRESLVNALVDLEGGMALTFQLANLERLGRDDTLFLRRIMIPMAKMRATRKALLHTSACLEVLGGNGYMEDWPMARQLRDAQCHPIWEGTENILAIDVRRAMRTANCHEVLYSYLDEVINSAPNQPAFDKPVEIMTNALDIIKKSTDQILGSDEKLSDTQVKRFANYLGDLCQAVALLNEAKHDATKLQDYRKALILSVFTELNLQDSRTNSLLHPDMRPVELFEPIIRYGTLKSSDIC